MCGLFVPSEMACKITCRLFVLTHRVVSCRTASSSCGGRFKVQHDRENRRFTVTTGSSGRRGGAAAGIDPPGGPGATYSHTKRDSECAVLHYRFTGQKEVDLMSTFVPETLRGQGIAAVLSQAALDFLVEEKLKARVSCWYIKKYIDEQPEQQYKDFIIS